MINIRPISDLRNKFTEIEKMVKKGEVVHLTKNGYGSMVVMSTERYSQLLEAEGKEAAQEEGCQLDISGTPQRKRGEPENPELAREQEEASLGTHEPCKNGIVPVPSLNGFRF